LQKQSNGLVPQNAGEVNCGGIPDYLFIVNSIRHCTQNIIEQFSSIHRVVSEVSDVYINRYPNTDFDAETNGDLGAKFLLKEIEQVDFKRELIRRETLAVKQRSIRSVLDMFLNTSIMMLNAISNARVLTNEQIDANPNELTKGLNKLSVPKFPSLESFVSFNTLFKPDF
jgi:hypothetical protein